MIFLFSSMLLAQEQISQPLRVNVNLGGMIISGNLNQVMLNGGGMVSYSQPRYGNDFIFNGYRMWTRLPASDGLVKIGDDLNLTTIPYRYLSKKHYVVGLLGYASSQLHQVEHRVLGGIGIGYAPWRQKHHLVRMALGGFFEHTQFPGDTFSIDVVHDGNTRSVPRIGLMSNGWYRIKKSPISLRYIAWLYVHPLQPEDFRVRVNTNINIRIADPLSLRFSCTYEQSSVVMEGVSPFDLRSNIGLAFSYPPKGPPK